MTHASDKSTDSVLPKTAITDFKVYSAFPEAIPLIVAPYLPANDNGLIGRNRKWGALYSPRFQLGAGYALRMAVAVKRPHEAARAFRAVEVGADVILSNGYVPSKLPPHIEGSPSASDIASGAAFFLGDACLGYLSLEGFALADSIVSSEQRIKMRKQLGLAVSWLLTQQTTLMEVDRFAPNRLLFNARSFQACGLLAEDSKTQIASDLAAKHFVEAALKLYSDDGHFIEGDGHDTSYQGVAIRIGQDILLAGYEDQKSRLSETLALAAIWLSKRVDEDGRINSFGNTRTCWSEETVFGERKLISVSDIFLALAYSAIRHDNKAILESANRIKKWASANSDTNPCFR